MTKREKELAVIIVALLIGALLALCFVNANAQCVGKERWDVKSLKDNKVSTTAKASRTTIHEQCAITRPSGDWLSLPRQSSESTLYQMSGKIIAFGAESDSDFHCVLSDGKETMICECPKPECANSKFATMFVTVRKWLVAHIGKPHAIKRLAKPIPCTITGYGFFDKVSHGFGHAKNGREVHPILSIQ